MAEGTGSLEWPKGWDGHRAAQRRDWARLTPLERLNLLEETKRTVAIAWHARAISDPGFAARIEKSYVVAPDGISRRIESWASELDEGGPLVAPRA